MHSLIHTVRESPVRYWLLIFLLLNVFLIQDGKTNVLARIGMMAAMIDGPSFQIDPRWTEDRAETPDGRIYANKAPGAAFIGLPVFWLIDQFVVGAEDGDVWRVRKRHRGTYNIILSLLLQVIPFMFLTALIIEWLRKRGTSLISCHFTALALLFGTTAALFMNTYFGHGMAAIFLLAAVFSFLIRRYIWAGFLFGFALLTDYGLATVLLPLLATLAWRERKLTPFLHLLLGGLLPGILWTWYHWSAFGTPFTIALAHQIPRYADQEVAGGGLSAVLSTLPSFSVLIELLVGSSRGLLFTQPWVLFVVGLALWFFLHKINSPTALPTVALAKTGEPLRKDDAPVTLFAIALPSLFLLLWINASFNGWHGGAAPGPRYLSPLLPLFGLSAGLLYDHISKTQQKILWLLLGVSLLFTLLALSTDILAPNEPLWPHFLGLLFQES